MAFGKYDYGYGGNRILNMSPFQGHDSISRLSLNEFDPRSQRRRYLNSYSRHSDYDIDTYHHDNFCVTCLFGKQYIKDGAAQLVYDAQEFSCDEPLCVYSEDYGYDRSNRGRDIYSYRGGRKEYSRYGGGALSFGSVGEFRRMPRSVYEARQARGKSMW